MKQGNHHTKEWVDDFNEFLNSDAIAPIEKSTKAIFSHVIADLNPPEWYVFSKLALVQAVVGAITLMFCPQFGIGLFSDLGLMSLFMHYGETACMLGCGGVFLGSGALVSSIILKPQEIKVIRRNRMLQLALLGTISLGVFICLGASIAFALGAAWLVGSTLGGIATLEFSYFVCTFLRRKVYYNI